MVGRNGMANLCPFCAIAAACATTLGHLCGAGRIGRYQPRPRLYPAIVSQPGLGMPLVCDPVHVRNDRGSDCTEATGRAEYKDEGLPLPTGAPLSRAGAAP